eukprot:11159622-Lingulodinium_polyedra.AAC.1
MEDRPEVVQVARLSVGLVVLRQAPVLLQPGRALVLADKDVGLVARLDCKESPQLTVFVLGGPQALK